MSNRKQYVSEISARNFSEIAAAIKDYRDSLAAKSNILLDTIAQEGVRIAIEQSPVGMTGEAIAGNKSERPDPETVLIINDSEDAVYYEFGTGAVGEASPHPKAVDAHYSYNIAQENHLSKYGKDGWFYRGDDGEIYWTEGQPAGKFFYNTAVIIRSHIHNWADQIWRRM